MTSNVSSLSSQHAQAVSYLKKPDYTCCHKHDKHDMDLTELTL